MARKRDPKRDEAFELWKQHDGNITNRAIAEQLEVPEKTISAWKSRDKWNATLQNNDCSTTNKKRSTTKENPAKKARSPNKKEVDQPVVESDELTEKQRLFCMYYTKYFNATKAYQKAYECAYFTAKTNGNRLLTNANIKKEIERLKVEQQQSLFLEGKDVLQKYIDIAFSDIGDYVERDRIGYSISVKPFEEMDMSIITEISNTENGLKIKFADKMKALDFLSKYMDLLSENDRKKLQEEKLKADIAKARSETKGTGNANISVVDFSNLSTEELRAIANSNKRTD